jgi:hypothetical protein
VKFSAALRLDSMVVEIELTPGIIQGVALTILIENSTP